MSQQEALHKLRVFISWSGDRSKALAQALHEWIPLVLHNVEPWMSKTDIAAGERWGEAIAKELEISNFGIICLTRENLETPWVIFEAGALAKSLLGSKVIPLLLDLEFTDITGPLAQFQAKKVEQDGLREVITSLNQTAGQVIPEAHAKKLFEALWPELEKRVVAIPKQMQAAKPNRPQHVVLEELVASVRTLDSRFREVLEEPPRGVRGRKLRFHPDMIMDLLNTPPEFGEAGLLMLAGFVRDQVPWLYEPVMDVVKAIRSGDQEEMDRCRRSLRMLSELAFRGPWSEIILDSREANFLVRELPRVLDEYLSRHIEQARHKTTKKVKDLLRKSND